MIFQQEHLPRDEPATGEESWPFNLESFLEERWIYLVAVVIIIVVFLYARHRWRKRHGI